jgi:exosortase/archaeosortase family protein
LESSPASEPQRETTARGARSFLSANRDLFVHWFVFLAILGLMVAIDQWAFRWINSTLAEWTAHGTAITLRLLGVPAHVEGISMRTPMCYFQIIGECTAYYPCAIFLAAVAAFPCRWTRRVAGILVGIPLILLINQLRLASLCYISILWPDLYDSLHLIVWQSLMIVVTVLLWLLWVMTMAGGHEARST